MPDLYTYNYAVIRVVPRVEREEFVNVGVIISCPAKKFLEASIEIDEYRLMALDPSLDLDSLKSHLTVIPKICAGGEQSGPIGGLSQRERFHWLCAPRSTMIQVSAVHSGLCEKPESELKHLMDSMVRLPKPKSKLSS